MNTCPICTNPVDTNTEAHVTGADGQTYHADCYSAQADTPVDLPPIEG